MLEIERNQLEEDLDTVISDLRWLDIVDRLDEVVAGLMAELSRDE
jgi:hypothetical protein